MKLWMPEVVQLADIRANDYNPNVMPSTEMGLLMHCIGVYGFLFPLILNKPPEGWDGKYVIIDGFHRFETLRRMGETECHAVVLSLKHHEAVQLTVLMNRIKGMHQVEGMSNLVVKLEHLGLEDTEICKNLGMEPEEFLRLKQQLGIAHAHRGHQYNDSWQVKD